MRAVDTNILTRYFRQDDSRQSPAALQVMAGRAVFCPKTVVLEFERVMRYVYRHEPADIARCLTTLLNLPNVLIEDEQQVMDALRGCERGMAFADALHLAAFGAGARPARRFGSRLRKAVARAGRRFRPWRTAISHRGRRECETTCRTPASLPTGLDARSHHGVVFQC